MSVKAKKSKASPAGAVKNRLLFAVGEREVAATSFRLLQYPIRLASLGYKVDVMTYGKGMNEQLDKTYSNVPGINIITIEPEDRFWTMRQRDGFAKTFIKHYSDVIIPDTDMRYWKASAFDDFLWHVSRNTMPRIEGEYDAVFLPVPSAFERPKEVCDVFYTNVVYYCKQNNVPLVGMQLYPVPDLPPIYLNIPDYWIVDEPLKGQYFVEQGINRNRVLHIDDFRDNYCISCIDDPYKALAMDYVVPIPKDTLAIAVLNHPANRVQLREIIEVLGRFKHKKTVMYMFVGMSVRELSEKDVFEDLIAPELRKHVGNYYTVEQEGILRTMMSCDAVISTNYITPLSFMSSYGKTSVIYNPLRQKSDYVQGVTYVDSREELQQQLDGAWRRKKATTDLADALARIFS